MKTVHPSIIIGAYNWDQTRLPRDEFQIRGRDLERAMDENGWKAIFVYGDADEHSTLAYCTGFVPRVRWALALLPREGEPRLLASMSSRDVPAMKLMTWIPDVVSGWQWQAAFDPWIAGLKGDAPIGVGTIGFERMQPRLLRAVEKSIGDFIRLAPAKGFEGASRALRPRELSLLRESCAVVKSAAAAMVKAWQSGAGAEAAVLEGERSARALAAQDVRTLVSLDGGRTLVPFRGEFKPEGDALVAHVAVKVMGYWAELFVSAAKDPGAYPQVQRALDALKAAARPGQVGEDLHAAAVRVLGTRALHPVLTASVGRRVGLSLDEGCGLTAESAAPMTPGSVYSLHVGLRDEKGGALASAMVVVGARGIEVLCESKDALAL
ncbi:MAG: M24 family metallopeptidase [Burkholderiales bacterium]|nr:M24 family metallopeptidase [Burkholderiales bacterium]